MADDIQIRDFTPTRPIPKEGPKFKLYDEVFHCIPAPPGRWSASLVGQVNVADTIERVLVREELVEGQNAGEGDDTAVWKPTDDLERWNLLMDDPERPVDADTLIQIVVEIARKYAGNRPTQRSAR